eukprot:530817-Rhodomonas_salina.1
MRAACAHALCSISVEDRGGLWTRRQKQGSLQAGGGKRSRTDLVGREVGLQVLVCQFQHLAVSVRQQHFRRAQDRCAQVDLSWPKRKLQATFAAEVQAGKTGDHARQACPSPELQHPLSLPEPRWKVRFHVLGQHEVTFPDLFPSREGEMTERATEEDQSMESTAAPKPT